MEVNAPQNAQRTILVVDDDAEILKYVAGLLVNSNYNVLTASNGESGIQQARNYGGEIHLLLTDFQMPKMTGIELATALCVDRPDLKVLLMSGFTGGMLVLNEGWHFLAKPFIASQLRTLIRGLIPAVADNPRPSQGARRWVNPARLEAGGEPGAAGGPRDGS